MADSTKGGASSATTIAVVVALIGLMGTLGVALIENWATIFGPPGDAAPQTVVTQPPVQRTETSRLDREDCINHDISQLKVERVAGDFKITEGDHWLLSFGAHADEAERTLEIMRHYNTNQQCYVGRPHPSLTYVLSWDEAPSGALEGEDCIQHDPAKLAVSETASGPILSDGRSQLTGFEDLAEAETALAVIRKHGFTHICYVGWPEPSFVYLRK